jgi:hypothetical protein
MVRIPGDGGDLPTAKALSACKESPRTCVICCRGRCVLRKSLAGCQGFEPRCREPHRSYWVTSGYLRGLVARVSPSPRRTSVGASASQSFLKENADGLPAAPPGAIELGPEFLLRRLTEDLNRRVRMSIRWNGIYIQANADGLARIVRSEADVELTSLAIEHLSRSGTVAARSYLQEFAKRRTEPVQSLGDPLSQSKRKTFQCGCASAAIARWPRLASSSSPSSRTRSWSWLKNRCSSRGL